MSKTMTCWKEIAQYLRKGVRTVQRWEQDLGLPVHRPHGKPKGTLLAYSDEIDAWVRSHFQSAGQSELDALRDELDALKKQNEFLRARLELAERSASLFHLNDSHCIEAFRDEVLLRRCSYAVQKNHSIRCHCAQLRAMSRTMQVLYRAQSKQNPERFRTALTQRASKAVR